MFYGDGSRYFNYWELLLRQKGTKSFTQKNYLNEYEPIKKIFKFLIWFIYSVIVGIIILEIGLRFFPVSKPLIWKDKSEILRYEPHQNGVWSLGKSFNNVIFIESNNYGYRANYDYKKK